MLQSFRLCKKYISRG